MKKVVLHTTFCKRKKKGKCRLCNQLLALSCFHAKKCRDRKCLVPYCLGPFRRRREQKSQNNEDTAAALSQTGPEKQVVTHSDPKETREQSIERNIQFVMHASKCRDDACRLPACLGIKIALAHTRSCSVNTGSECSNCKKLIYICCYHAKQCAETKCPMPFCVNIRQELGLRQLQVDKQVQEEVPHQGQDSSSAPATIKPANLSTESASKLKVLQPYKGTPSSRKRNFEASGSSSQSRSSKWPKSGASFTGSVVNDAGQSDFLGEP